MNENLANFRTLRDFNNYALVSLASMIAEDCTIEEVADQANLMNGIYQKLQGMRPNEHAVVDLETGDVVMREV